MVVVAIKKLLSRFLFPVPFVLELLLVGLLVLVFARSRTRRGMGWFLIVSAGLFLAMFASPPFADNLLRGLEARVAPLDEATLVSHLGDDGVVASSGVVVAVLGHWTLADAERLPLHRVSSEFQCRLAEGVRVVQMLNGHGVPAELAVTMANESIPSPERAAVLDEVLGVYGAVTNQPVMLTGCYDTQDEIAQLAALAAGRMLILASTASHLPRAVLLAHQVGVDAIAAPTGAWTGRSTDYEWHCYIPCAQGVQTSERAVYEYIGIAVTHLSYRLRHPFGAPTRK
jgi:uncharacterized SAM-binding protein YcdF (DUF218 family)